MSILAARVSGWDPPGPIPHWVWDPTMIYMYVLLLGYLSLGSSPSAPWAYLLLTCGLCQVLTLSPRPPALFFHPAIHPSFGLIFLKPLDPAFPITMTS